MKMKERDKGKIYDLGFIDPDTIHETTVKEALYASETEDSLVKFLVKQHNKDEILFPYNFK